MAKLTYWIAKCEDDSDCYSLIGKTRKDVQAQLDEHWNRERFAEPVKLTITYRDAFDLFEQVTNEGGGRSCGLTAAQLASLAQR